MTEKRRMIFALVTSALIILVLVYGTEMYARYTMRHYRPPGITSSPNTWDISFDRSAGESIVRYQKEYCYSIWRRHYFGKWEMEKFVDAHCIAWIPSGKNGILNKTTRDPLCATDSS